MASVIALFTGLCGFREKTQPRIKIQSGNHSSLYKATKREHTNDDLQDKENDDLQDKENEGQGTNASDDNTNEANHELPLPPARKAALRGTYSCNNMMVQNSKSTKKKLSATLTIQMPRASSMAQTREGEEDKSVKKKKLKADKSILVRPIILGEKCRVLDHEEEGDEDHSHRMPKNIIYHPRTTSSISISRSNSKIDTNVIPVKESPEDSNEKREKITV